jgi:hypothetical protein
MTEKNAAPRSRHTCRQYDLCIYTGTSTPDIESGAELIVIGNGITGTLLMEALSGAQFNVPAASLKLTSPAVAAPSMTM